VLQILTATCSFGVGPALQCAASCVNVHVVVVKHVLVAVVEHVHHFSRLR
jgi:hypothetical protein